MFDREVEHGGQARGAGNEGMARVCARRAAGIVVRAYAARRGAALPGKSVLNYLQYLQEARSESEEVRGVASHFLLRITPEHVLPEDVDLIAEVAWLARTLFPDCP